MDQVAVHPGDLLEPRAPDSAFQQEQERRRSETRAAFDRVHAEADRWRTKNAYYHAALEQLMADHVPPGASVLELGCGTGELLAALRPERGVGVDFSETAIETARSRHPNLRFLQSDAEALELGGETFDFVVLSDLLGFVDDIWLVLRRVRAVCHERTRVVIATQSAVWEPLLGLATRLGQRAPVPYSSWLGHDQLENLLYLNHFELVRRGSALLLPKRVPLLAPLCNRVLANLPLVRHLNLVLWMVARPTALTPARDLSASVIIPTRNERGNVDALFERVPELGSGTELLFVDGHSTDGTVDAIEERLPTRDARLLKQTGRGKGDAVRLGFSEAKGDVLFILDSDITVPPEDLPKFFLAVAEGRGEFINGTRLVYPMEDEAMRTLNRYGNKFFSVLLSWITGQSFRDTLCGTKVLSAEDYRRIEAGRSYFGDFDPFGDFDLLFGAARQNLKIVEVPVRYRARTYGDTKISRFRHGLLLLRMSFLALRKFKLKGAA